MVVFKGRVIDGNGRTPIEEGLVAVDGNKILYVGEAAGFQYPQDAEVITVPNGTVMPGFIEGHCHLGLGDDYLKIFREHTYNAVCRTVKQMETLLECGFTSMRECGGLTNYLKPSWSQGVISGPRIFSAGRSITQSGGHADPIKYYPIEFSKNPERVFAGIIADGVPEVQHAARLQFREGADFLKVMLSPGTACQARSLMPAEYSDEELNALVEEANNFGSYVCVHAHSNLAIKMALRCGVKSIEHGSYLQPEDAERMAMQGTILTPTFATNERSSRNMERLAPWQREKVAQSHEHRAASARMAHEAGVTIGYGCDFGGGEITPFDLNGMEFELLVTRAGLTPMEAIMAATKTNSKLILSEDTLGTLEAGKLADVVVAAGNPLEDISILGIKDNIKVVMQNGIIKKNLLVNQ